MIGSRVPCLAFGEVTPPKTGTFDLLANFPYIIRTCAFQSQEHCSTTANIQEHCQMNILREIRKAKKVDALWELNSEIRRRKIYAQAGQTEADEDRQKPSLERNAIAASVRAKLRLKKAADHMREVRKRQKEVQNPPE